MTEENLLSGDEVRNQHLNNETVLFKYKLRKTVSMSVRK